MSRFKAKVCGLEYTNMDGTGWPYCVVVDNDGDVLKGTYDTRTYYPIDRKMLIELADLMEGSTFEYAGDSEEIKQITEFSNEIINGYARCIREALGLSDEQ